MTTRADESRPEEAVPEAAKTFAGVLPHSTDLADLVRRAEMAGYVVRATTTLANGVVKVQHYASLHSAVKAHDRAAARGTTCVLTLCRVLPTVHVEIDGQVIS